MRLLFLSPYLPGRILFGGSRRIHGLVSELGRFNEVALLALVDSSLDHRPGLEAARGYCTRAEIVGDRLHQVEGRAKRALQFGTLVAPFSWERLRYFRPAFQRALDAHLARHAYDVIVCEFVFMSHFRIRVPLGQKAPRLVVDEHNVEYDLLRRTAAASSFSRRVFLEANWRKLKREEVAVWRRFDACAVTSVRDQDIVREEAPETRTAVVPNGVDIEGFSPRDVPTEPLTMLFFGAINYYPNTDGVLWFASHVLPLLRASEPNIRLRIVGPGAEGPVQDLSKDGVEVTGFVDDVKAEIAKAAVVVVPLRIGGGTRLKIVEAMGMGKAIVSTKLGAEGIDITHDKDILLADSPEDFARQILRVLRDSGLAKRLGDEARATAVAGYSWRSAAQKLHALCETLLDSTRPGEIRAPAPRVEE